MFMPCDLPPALSPARTTDTRGDIDLAQDVCDGDGSAFEVIMRRHNRLLFRTARGVVADDAEAQDVVQETYLRAFSAMRAFRGDSALGTWLARIAINVAVSSQRKKGRLVQMEDSEPLDGDSSLESAMPHLTATESPEGAAERGELRELLQTAIDRLPPIYRSTFMLRAVEELSVEEAAFCLQVSEAVVKTRYLRARNMLRDTLVSQIESHLQQAYAFAGARCESVVSNVLAELHLRGFIRLH